jgi:hypothetical protein
MGQSLVQRLAGILFQMRTRNPDGLGAPSSSMTLKLPRATTGSSYWLIW